MILQGWNFIFEAQFGTQPLRGHWSDKRKNYIRTKTENNQDFRWYLPIQSGRNYRYQEITDKQLYNTYYSEVTHGDPVSNSFFIYSVIGKKRVRDSKKFKT